MPRGRFLSRDVSTSERLANLRTDFARLLWSWCVPHTDRDGRLPGSSRVLRATVVPMLDVSNDDVGEAVADLVRCRLAVLYDSDGTPALQILKFKLHQTGMRYDREAPSKHGPAPDVVRTNSGPAPSAQDDSGSGPGPDNSGCSPPEAKGSEAKSSKDQMKAGAPAAGPSPAEVKKVWSHFIERRSRITKANPPALNDTRRNHIKARLRSYGMDRVLAAVTSFLDPQSWHVLNSRIQPELVFRADDQLEKHEGNGGGKSEREWGDTKHGPQPGWDFEKMLEDEKRDA